MSVGLGFGLCAVVALVNTPTLWLGIQPKILT